jgi:hypothetical protein
MGGEHRRKAACVKNVYAAIGHVSASRYVMGMENRAHRRDEDGDLRPASGPVSRRQTKETRDASASFEG